MKSSNIFWGVLLVVLGSLIFMRNFDLFHFSWGSFFRLWPFIFIFWGIAILPVKPGFKVALSILAAIIGIIILVSSPNTALFWEGWKDRHIIIDRDDSEDSWKEQHLSESFDTAISRATLNLDIAAGEFTLKGSTPELYEFETRGNAGPFNATVRKSTDDAVIVDFGHRSFRRNRNLKNEVWLHLNENPVWNLNVDVGAADLEMDLSPYKIDLLEIDGGASAIKLKIGDLYHMTRININAGAAGIEINVPRESACEIRTETILSGKDFNGFVKIKDGLYQTPNFSDTVSQVIIEVEAAVSGVKVERY